jgi:hypothetical protein
MVIVQIIKIIKIINIIEIIEELRELEENMDTQNITLAVPKNTLLKFKELAFRRQKSVSGLMVEVMEEMVNREDEYIQARDRQLRKMETGLDLGTYGKIPWKRDDLHER